MENKLVKMYFKGSSGIQNPVDVDGKPINEGDILTHCWFDGAAHSWIKKSEEEKEKLFMQPSVIVKKNEAGGFYAESIDPDPYLYMHDFRFKYTKNLSAIEALH